MARSLATRFLLVAVVAFGIPACGGGGGGGAAPVTVTLGSIAGLDGFVLSDGTAVTGSAGPGVGDTAADAGARQFWSFDVSGIPSGATVTLATFRARQRSVFGDPYAFLGNVIVERVDIGVALDGTDFAVAGIGAFVVLSTDTTIEVKTVDITDRVQAALAAAATRIDLRARGQAAITDGDGTQEVASFADADGSNGETVLPELEITYTLP